MTAYQMLRTVTVVFHAVAAVFVCLWVCELHKGRRQRKAHERWREASGWNEAHGKGTPAGGGSTRDRADRPTTRKRL